MPRVASRDARLVPFSWFYSALLRDAFVLAKAEHEPEGGHEYSAKIATVVILAGFTLEGAINEIADWLKRHLTQPVTLPDDFDDRRIFEKWDIVPRACGTAGFDRGRRPWQDFVALVELRNRLAHPPAYALPPEACPRWYARATSARCAAGAFTPPSTSAA